jgi:phosphoglycerate dehydrogenase-like enzyme
MASTTHLLITLPLDESLLQQLRNISPRLEITVYPTRRMEDIPADVWARTEILYTDVVLPAPEQVPSLRWIQFHWAGIDRLVDSPLLKQPDITVTTLSGASASQMAEFILTMVLTLGHHLPGMLAAQRQSEWPSDRWERFKPVELRGSTVGLIGYGSIARQTARLLQVFGATILAVKRDAKQPLDKGYTPEGLGDPDGMLANRIYPVQALNSMLKECDFVAVTLPLTAETRNLISTEALNAMKTGCYLIDVSRGGVIDHTALIKALKSGKLSGASLDVFPQEPLPADSPLWKMSNVIISPHVSGNSRYYDERAVNLFAENIQRYLADSPLYNIFDADRGY